MSVHVLIPPPPPQTHIRIVLFNVVYVDLAAYSLLVSMFEIQIINSINSAFEAKTEIKEALKLVT